MDGGEDWKTDKPDANRTGPPDEGDIAGDSLSLLSHDVGRWDQGPEPRGKNGSVRSERTRRKILMTLVHSDKYGSTEKSFLVAQSTST